MNKTLYSVPPSLAGFLQSKAFVSLVSGPVGSGKSSAAMLKIAYHAKQMRKQNDGVRRSRAVVIRNTRQMLTDATLPTFFTWFPDGVAGAYLKTDTKFILKFDDVECEILFRGLDDSNDVRRLLSLEVSFGVMDEFREIHADIFNALQGRVGRYPSVKDGGCVDDNGEMNYHIWGATNAPDADTFWEKYMTEPPGTAEVFMQPSAMSPLADWLANLPPGYYDKIAEGKTEDWIDVYIHNKFGKSLSGKPVFRGFIYDFHVAKKPLTPIISSEHPLIVAVDLGLTPACTINQQDHRGRYLTFAELQSDGMGILRFSREKLKPLLSAKFPGHPVQVICDPAGMQRAQTDERSVVDVLKAEGFNTIPARTNVLSARIAAMEALLAAQIDGEARHLIDPSCKALISALRGGYRYKVKTNGETEDKPDKNFASHLAEGHCYGALHVDSVFGGSQMLTAGARREIVLQSAYGWT